MWILEFLMFSITALIIWTLFGYFVFLYLVGILRRKKTFDLPDVLPTVSVIIPCFNEESEIYSKIINLRETDYPEGLIEFIFIDGGSTDRTCEIIEEEIKGADSYRLIKSERRGKINQINQALREATGKIIVNTDVDARLRPDVIKRLISEFQDLKVLVSGAFCSPSDTIDVERYFWLSQNKGRVLESRAYASFIVVAPCYAFRRWLIDSFPEDVVADDIYIASCANAIGGKTVYIDSAIVEETRGPKDYSDFISHKFRKSNAYLRETLRFLYRLPEMNGMLKMMYITKVAQQLLLPYCLIAWCLVAGAMLTLFRYDIVVICLLSMIIAFFITNRVFASIKVQGQESFGLFTVVRGYLLTVFILLATGLAYPFYKQDSSYSRLASADNKEWLK